MASRRMLLHHSGSRSLRGRPTGHRQHHHGAPYRPSDVDLLLGLASPGAFPCPEASPTYNVQFSNKAGDGHLVAFGTEFGQLVIVDTRAEARVQRDHNGPVGWGQTDRTRTISSGAASTRRRLKREVGGPVGSVGYCRSWGVRQPEVVAQYRALVNCIFDLEWTHDDSRIALGCGDGKIRVHDTETHAELLVLCGHGGSVKTVATNPIDNDILLSGSRDGSFALWDTRTRQGQDNPEMDGLHRMTDIESSLLATAPANRFPTRYLSPVEQVYRANYGVLNQHRKRPRSFTGRDGEYPEATATAAASATTPPVPRQKSGTSTFVGLPCHSSVTAVCWMKDGQKFLTAGQDGLVKLWDTRYAARPLQAELPSDHSTPGRRSPRTSNVNAAACPSPPPSSPLPSSLSSPSTYGRPVPRSGDLRRGGERSRKGGGLGGRVTGGEVVAEESYSGVAGGRPYGVSSVHACDDGSRIAVCTVKNHISVYSYASGSLQLRGTFTGNNNTSSYYIKAKLSPDGSILASGATNDAVCLWQVDCPGSPVARLMGHVNEVTGLDFCRAEPLKLATCSDDETVRVWTIDPLRVMRNSSSSSSSPRATPAGSGDCPASGPHVRDAIGNGRGGNGGSGSAAVRGISGWTPIPVLPGVVSRGEPVGGSDDGNGDDDDGRGSFVSRGKFGLGTARIGESSSCRRRRREPGTGPAGGDVDGAGGCIGRGSGQCQRQASGRTSQSWSGSESGECAGMIEALSSSPPHTRTQPKVGTLPSRSESSDGPVVFCPRSPNKKAGMPRTPTSPSAGLANAAVGVSVALIAAAQGSPPMRADENTAPDPVPTPQGDVDGGLTAVVEGSEQGDSSMDLELGRLDVGTGVTVVDRSTDASRKGNRGLLDGLPCGWSTAKGVQAAGRGLWQRPQRNVKEQERKEEEGRKKLQKQQQRKRKSGTHKGGRGATSRGNPLSRDNPTLMEFWEKDQAAPSGGMQGQGKASAATGLERHGPGS